MKLQEKYAEIVNEYISVFTKKQGVDFDYWIADRIGEIAAMGDYFFNFSDIKYDIDNDVPKGKIFDWYDDTMTKALQGKETINYENFLKRNNFKNRNK